MDSDSNRVRDQGPNGIICSFLGPNREAQRGCARLPILSNYEVAGAECCKQFTIPQSMRTNVPTVTPKWELDGVWGMAIGEGAWGRANEFITKCSRVGGRWAQNSQTILPC